MPEPAVLVQTLAERHVSPMASGHPILWHLATQHNKAIAKLNKSTTIRFLLELRLVRNMRKSKRSGPVCLNQYFVIVVCHKCTKAATAAQEADALHEQIVDLLHAKDGVEHGTIL